MRIRAIEKYLFSNFLYLVVLNSTVFSMLWSSIETAFTNAAIVYFLFRLIDIYSSPFTSRLSDKFDRKLIVKLSYLYLLGIIALLSAFIILFGELPLIVSIFIVVSLGFMSGLTPINSRALLHDSYGPRVKTALRLGGIFASARMFIAPVFGALFSISFGSLTALFISAIVLLAATLIVWSALRMLPSYKFEKQIDHKNESVSQIKLIGLVWKIRIERFLILSQISINSFLTPFFMIVMPYLAFQGHFAFPELIALLDMIFAAGMYICNKYLIKKMKGKLSDSNQVLVGFFLMAIMVIFGVSTHVWVSLLSMFAGGIGIVLYGVNISAFRIRSIPQSHKARMLSVVNSWSMAFNPWSIVIFSFCLASYNFSAIWDVVSIIILVFFILHVMSFLSFSDINDGERRDEYLGVIK
ncbi:MFS transporter [Veronia pacifica]|uniref:Major facilitator superfamily (MFS) profile domain-containing protein n=1 Tax=Veronia pacifica TaxID=1080227 RepID=A0A1C3ES16_9GAMM|nr:MFS transporter [Veronia pacifica]ODA36033.1 hypothetical protein A8L45_00005 [Veronia pacifica]